MEDERWINRGNSRLTNMILGQRGVATSINENGLIPNIYTVQFGFVETGDRDSTSVPSANAIVIWSVKGQQQRRILSIASGSAISGVCDAVNIKIRDTSILSNGAKPIPYAIQTTLTKGPRASTGEPPSLTTSENQIVSGGVTPGATFIVPVDAGVMSFFVFACGDSGAVLAVTDIVVQVVGSGGILLAAYYPLITGKWVPLPAGAYAVIINSNASESTNADVNVI